MTITQVHDSEQKIAADTSCVVKLSIMEADWVEANSTAIPFYMQRRICVESVNHAKAAKGIPKCIRIMTCILTDGGMPT